MNFTLKVFALVSLIGGTIVLYFFSIKTSWMRQRKKKLIVNDDDYNNIHLWSKCKFTKKPFIGECISILLFSFFLSAIITMFYIWQAYGINDFDINKVGNGCFWFVGIYIILIGIDEEQENIDKLENKSLKNIIKFIMKIKTFIIKGLVSNETKNYKDFIKSKMKDCINNNNDFIAILIICIDENSFEKKIVRDEFRDELKDLNAELVHAYNNKQFTLEENLVDFFTKDLIRYNFSYLEILEFIDNVEKRIGLYNKHEIDSKLDRLKPYNKPLPKLKEQDIEELGKLVNDVFQAFDSASLQKN